jgi:Na+/phosphate symporter
MSDEKYSYNSDSDLDVDINIDLDLKIEQLTEKVDEILDILKKDISKNTKKMSNHINFVETVYENVKSPLGFICNIITRYIGSTKYTLHNKSNFFKKLK